MEDSTMKAKWFITLIWSTGEHISSFFTDTIKKYCFIYLIYSTFIYLLYFTFNTG